MAWAHQYDNNATSYGKSYHHSEKWWHTFIHQCHDLGLVHKQLWSVIKKGEHSFIQGILVQDTKTRPYVASAGIEDGIQYVHSMKPLMSKIPTPAKIC